MVTIICRDPGFMVCTALLSILCHLYCGIYPLWFYAPLAQCNTIHYITTLLTPIVDQPIDQESGEVVPELKKKKKNPRLGCPPQKRYRSERLEKKFL